MPDADRGHKTNSAPVSPPSEISAESHRPHSPLRRSDRYPVPHPKTVESCRRHSIVRDDPHAYGSTVIRQPWTKPGLEETRQTPRQGIRQTARIPAVEIRDLTDDYAKFAIESGDLQGYQETYPELFRHYLQYWGSSKTGFARLSERLLRRRSRLIRRMIGDIESLMLKSGFTLTGIEAVLFVGQRTSNGHALRDGDSWIVWLPLEAYPTALQMRVFVTHEILHALHYRESPDFYFDSMAEKRSVVRRLITEGVATWLTMRVLGIDERTALWADYIPRRKIRAWLQECKAKEHELCKFILENLFSSDPAIGVFYAKDADDIFNYRAGYYIGLKLIKHIATSEKITRRNLLAIPRKDFETLAKIWLEDRVRQRRR